MSFKGSNFLSFDDWTSDTFRRRSKLSNFLYGRKKIKIIDPQSPFLQRWNKIFLLACIFGLVLDPLFFFIPVIEGNKKCFDLDEKLEIVVCVLRTLIDVLYILRIIFQFRTGFIVHSSRVFGRGEWVEDPKIIARRYLTSNFIVDFLSILPLPQIVVSFVAKDSLKYVILFQYVPRLFRIYPLFREVNKSSSIITETAWAGAAVNLFFYMLASHIIGAFWYLLSIERVGKCWHKACDGHQCSSLELYCGRHHTNNLELSKLLKDSCPFSQPDEIKNSTLFNFGIFTDALDSGLVETHDFAWKFFYSFWWGLRNLSSLGQNLKTSNFAGEIIFAVFISIAGLVLFAMLIGNMQAYLQFITVKIEEMSAKKRNKKQLELWMSHRMLPENLRRRIWRYEHYKWQETGGVNERTLIHRFPKDIRKDINRHLWFDLIKRVPIFGNMDEHLLDATCDCLKLALYTENSYILREGDSVDEMLFITSGVLVSEATDGGRTCFDNATFLKAGDFCGEELFLKALVPNSPSNFSISTRTVKALTEVEAFALAAEDVKFVAQQLRSLGGKDIQHTFRFFSRQWRTWAACYIQAAWRRHCRRRQGRSLRQEIEKLQDSVANKAATSLSLGATMYTSQFHVKALRNLRQNGGRTLPILEQILAPVPEKPSEPDFSISLSQQLSRTF